jgi:hypothetical protein
LCAFLRLIARVIEEEGWQAEMVCSGSGLISWTLELVFHQQILFSN